ncbi:hypothetical protein FE257_007296 [Aspergillus nanangensis]|uniref:Smr domain protein n=1 Tax=Aspergillus nanangensis TaxID=2582783 RepID=A0AAD4CMS9_ASPNN|nr:hypothetical protein FE257_007296 [Aspergillus nanangensis]
MGEDGDGPLRDLEREYCPPLDPALFTAIACDFDISDPTQLQQLRETLDTLKLTAWEQEDLPFDPSGTSGLGPLNVIDGDGIVSEHSASQNGTLPSRETDITSLASEFSAASIGDKKLKNNSTGRSRSQRVSYTLRADGSMYLSGATEDDKIGYLSEMFPTVDHFTIKHTLGKSDGDVDRSMDVLLNFTFFDEQPSSRDGLKVAIPKGIDGFDECTNSDATRKKGRKRKGKNKNLRSSELSSSSPLDSEDLSSNECYTANKWDTAQKDVDFIHSRTAPILKKETVTSTYHANGASLPTTIRSLATAHAPQDEQDVSKDPVMATQVAELMQEFPSIPPILFAGLLNITRSSVSAASELASAMVTAPALPSVAEMIKITASPLPLDSEEEPPKRRTAGTRNVQDYGTARGFAESHFAAGSEALSKASLAYRRGKSDRLMGGAAAYYSAVGRDHLERAKRNAAAAADALVDSQSTTTMLDLHGVSVQDAVRISSARVSDWWNSLGDTKYMRGGRVTTQEYRIVTGAGRHSHDGTSRLGPAVGKMLAREGWRVEVGEGVLTVTGVVRRR